MKNRLNQKKPRCVYLYRTIKSAHFVIFISAEKKANEKISPLGPQVHLRALKPDGSDSECHHF